MNTNQIKRFAQETRRKLLEQVSAKLNFVLTTDSAELREKTKQLKQLRQELGRTTKEQLIEKVAYTWFNRLMALRFMDANDYQPLGIRIITPKDGYTIPELLDEAKRGNLPEELRINRERIYKLLDNKIPSTNPQNEVFKELLIATCNHLNTNFPFLFEKINDYTELLLPDDLTSDFSIVKDIRDGMNAENCLNVEIIGWLYQFYISEKKDEVFAAKSRVKKEDIPAATQLFTPRWIVEYMVQNTLGKLWLQNRPKSRLRERMSYYLESASVEAEDFLKINSPEEIKFLDPASGSGHILAYAFDLFTNIYEEEGYNTNEIPQLVIENNLFGFEIDERAAQLSGLTLMMKAREYQRRALKTEIKPNILCYKDLNLTHQDVREVFNSLKIGLSDELLQDLLLTKDATNLGSLIIPHTDNAEIHKAQVHLPDYTQSNDVFQQNKIEIIKTSLQCLKELSQKYHCVVANPPYMGSGNMNQQLLQFVQSNYPDTKADLMACFMESGLSRVLSKGFLGLINQQSWMYNPTYVIFRRRIIHKWVFDTLIHLGPHTFPEIGGEVVQNVSFTCFNVAKNGFNTVFKRLITYDNSESKRINFSNKDNEFNLDISVFDKLEGYPFAYWMPEKIAKIIYHGKSLKKYGEPRPGLQTSNNDRFLRIWSEVSYNKIGLSLERAHALKSSFKWFQHNKGGKNPRKWFGNDNLVINFENDGLELKNWLENNPNDPTTKHWSRNLRNYPYYFKEGITWSAMSSNQITARLNGVGFTFDTSGPTLFVSKNLHYFCGLLNSKVFDYFVGFFSQTLSKGTGDFSRVPVVINDLEAIEKNVIEVHTTAKLDWQSKETSLNFSKSALLKHAVDEDVETTFDSYKQFWKKKFFQTHQFEEQLNRHFIDIYDLVELVSPIVPFNEITLLQDETDKNAIVGINKRIRRDPNTYMVSNYDEISIPFISFEVFAQFISYSVGSMFGRFSLDKEGLILSNQWENLKDFFQKIEKSESECIFLPDADNIIPILDNEWFEDDIVTKFNHFLKVTFGEKNFNKNLAFIEEQLGKDIRRYFIKDFYPDHIKRYKKRPIYWMFSSPKGSFNVLIYMHRYTPDTVSNILNKYLKEFIGKLNTRKEHLEHVQVTGSASDKAKAIKEIDNIEKMLVELHEYERDVLYPLATERIEIDLDDGVLVNYNKFGKAVKEVNGLNDPATKKKVKQFDWIDTSQIR